ncbi:GapS1 family protein [Candidatus Rariloculus sp.]|uniref:GapS1 family protein n=1 Tax=Candidatus Rariloculus sp. TaxID=3101265 RepID=UPI003D0CD79E
MRRIPFNDTYKQWRNRARKYDPESIVRESLRCLREASIDQVEEFRTAPWRTLLIVKWVCQDKYLDGKIAPAITTGQLNDLRQRLWEFPQHLDRSNRETMPPQLLFRRILRSQKGFQRDITMSFVREAALLAEQNENYPLRRRFKEKTGFDVLDFIDLSLATFGAVIKGNRLLRDDWFSSLHKTYSGALVSAYQSSVSRTYPELLAFFRALPDASRKVASEYFEFPVLTRYPFFRTSEGMICWHPMVFYRGLEDFVHSVMSEEGQDYIGPFSKLFERHVVAESRKVPTRFIGEDDLREHIAPKTKVPDGLLSFRDCNVFVESKAALFNESAMTVGHRKYFARMTRPIPAAVEQAWATSVSLREQRSAPADVLNADTDYLLVVTNKELAPTRGTALASMYPKGTLDYPNAEAERLLPLSRVYVLAIDEFERLTNAAASAQVDMPAFLASCVEHDKTPVQSVHLFEQHLDRQQVRSNYSDLVERAFDNGMSRIEKTLSASTGILR